MTRTRPAASRSGDVLDRYFGGFDVARAKLAVFRVCFFGLVGIDGLLQIPHAPRYGAGDFHVGHFSWLEPLLPEPTRALMLVVFVWQAYLGFAIAFGLARKSALIALTALHGYGYFVSQLDSYQHHYLVFLLLFLACFIPWQAPEPSGARGDRTAAAGAPAGELVTSWAVRLVIVQVAIVYAWAGITKLEGLWLDGTLLDRQLPPGSMRDVAEWLGMGRAATLVMLTELFLCAALLWRRLWPFAVAVGCALHASIEFGAEFKIGIFSYYMFAFYALLLPDHWYRLASRSVAPRVRAVRSHLAWVRRGALRHGLAVLALGAGWLALAALPVDEAVFLATSTALFAALLAAWLRFRPADDAVETRRGRALGALVAHALACAAILFCPGTVDERIGDYYKFWGGSARRLEAWDQAETAYRRLTALRPGWAPGHYHLARIDQDKGDIERALQGYERAQAADPGDYRAFLAAAEIHRQAGRNDLARTAAERALALLGAMRPTAGVQRDLLRARALLGSASGP